MHTGTLTVTGESSTFIHLKGRPRRVMVHFRCDMNPIPCNPHHHDHLHWKIKFEDEPHHNRHKFGHHNHNRQFFLEIDWRVAGVREIDWLVIY